MLSNAGPGVLHWSIPAFSDPRTIRKDRLYGPFATTNFTASSPIVSAAPAQGSLAAGQTQEITLGISATTLTEGDYAVEVLIAHNDPSTTDLLVPVRLSVFTVRPGDVNADDKTNALDIIHLVNLIWREGPLPFAGTGDADCDSAITVPDILYLINYVYKNGPEPGCL